MEDNRMPKREHKRQSLGNSKGFSKTDMASNSATIDEALDTKFEGVLEHNEIMKKQINRLDAENRAKNIVIYGVSELADDNLQARINCVQYLCYKMGLQEILIGDVFRLGKKKADAIIPRPILVKLIRMVDKKLMIKKAPKLRNENIFISDDLNAEEREAGRILREKFRAIKLIDSDVGQTIRGDTMFIWKRHQIIKKYKVINKVAMRMKDL